MMHEAIETLFAVFVVAALLFFGYVLVSFMIDYRADDIVCERAACFTPTPEAR